MTMQKIENCPECGETLHSDYWTVGRKLQQCCTECGWRGKPRVPETREIKSTKKVMVGQFYGFHYEVFDKYGCAMTSSRYYSTKEEATEEMKGDLAQDNKNPDVAPCIGILWPDVVTVNGELFR